MIERTAKSVAVDCAAAAQTQQGNRDIPGRAVHPVIHCPGDQPTARDRIRRFGKGSIGVEPGDEGFRAHHSGNETRGDLRSVAGTAGGEGERGNGRAGAKKDEL